MPVEGVLDTHLDTQAGEGGDPAPGIGVSEHDKEMIAVADRGLDKEKVVEQNAEKLLAGKYKDEAALNKGVTELLKMQHPDMSVEDIYKGIETGKLVPSSTASANEPDDPAAGDKDGKTGGEVDDNAINKVSEKLNPLDPVALTLEREQNDGQLTPDTREKLVKEYNIPESAIDTYLAGLVALEGQFVGKVYELTGGEESYNTMLTWMNENVPEAELEVFNDQLATQDLTKVKLAVEGMNARHKAVVGDNPDLLRPDNSQTTTPMGGYASKAEWLEAMAKPEYNKSEVYRNEVIARLAKSTF